MSTGPVFVSKRGGTGWDAAERAARLPPARVVSWKKPEKIRTENELGHAATPNWLACDCSKASK